MAWSALALLAHGVVEGDTAAIGPVGTPFKLNPAEGLNVDWTGVAMGTNGQFLATWGGNAHNPGAVYARAFDSDNAPLGPQVILNNQAQGRRPFRPVVAARPGGDYVVVWYETFIPEDGVLARFVSAAGVPTAPEIEVLPRGEVFPRSFGVAVGPNGGFVVAFVWTPFSSRHLGLRAFAANGSPITEVFAGEQNAFPRVSAISIAKAPSGDFIVTWGDIDESDSDAHYARIFHFDGDPVTDTILVDAAGGPEFFDTACASSSNGDFLVSRWQYDVADGEVLARAYSGAGAPLTPQFRVDSVGGGAPSLARGREDEFVFAWARGDELLVRALSLSEGFLGPEITIPTQPAAGVSVTGTPDGDFVLVWTASDLPNGGANVWAVRLSRLELFADGFESGDTSAWSSSLPPLF